MTPSPTFHSASCEVAARFLHSVVVVDDRAEYARASVDVAGEGSTDDDATSSPKRVTRVNRKLVTPVVDPSIAEGLDAKALVDGFAAHGLVCAILRPAKAEDPDEKAVKVAARADIVVLDWNIHGDNGITTCDLVGRILQSDAEENRLRLIAIYTGERDLRRIARKLRAKLKSVVPSPRVRLNGVFAMAKGALRIAIFAKEGTRLLQNDRSGAKRIVKETELPERLIAEFASLTEGLVANVALASLAALRANTHRILGRLRPRLDPAYLWHRTVQATPPDAEDHLVSLVSGEVRSILDDAQVGKAAGMTAIDLWLRRDGAPPYGSQFGETEPRTIAEVRDLLREGSVGATPESKLISAKFKSMRRNEKPHRKTAALSVFATSATEATRSNEDFAVLMSIKTHYSHPIPRLQLGTVLARGTGTRKTYWICMQPRCDSVRLSAKRAFPLLPLSVPLDGNANFRIVIPSKKGPPLRLQLSKRPYELVMVEFSPKGSDADAILADEVRGGFRFASKKGFYRWLADVKEDHAQRIADEFAFQFGRVGLTESEWLELWATK